MESPDRIKAQLMDASDLGRTLDRMARQVVELITPDLAEAGAAQQNGLPVDAGHFALVGMQTRGVHLARRLQARIHDVEHLDVPVGALDATLYRDDLRGGGGRSLRAIRATQIPFDITGRDLVLIDDVVYTGRTGRAGLDALMDMGRPASVHFLVIIDRGLRELPIRPDIVGRTVPTLPDEAVRVRLDEVDDREGVWLVDTSP